MRLIHAASELNPGSEKVCLAIGVFDGVHLGHQQVIRQMVADSRQRQASAVVITFDRHPNAVVAPERIPPLIYPVPQKLRALAALGVDSTLLIHFDEAFSRQTGEQFIRGLAAGFGGLQSVSVGSTFTFGHRRSGTVALLNQLGHELHFAVHGLAAVLLDGEVVSSTRIREAVRQGHLEAAGQMLGRAYTLSGPVVHGDRLGRQLGFPTANLETSGLIIPPTGVYAVYAATRGVSRGGLLNIGYRPTLGNPAPQLRVEAHLFDFADDIYGEEVELTFAGKIREEQKFPSLQGLREQLSRDVVQARACLKAAPPTAPGGGTE